MADYKDFLRRLHENLNILQEREAKYGGNAPLDLLHQIKDHQTAVALTEQALQGDLDESEWRQALKPLLLAVEGGQTINIGAETYVAGDVQGDVIGGDKNIFVTLIQNHPWSAATIVILIALSLLIVLGITNLQPVEGALFATPTATATPTPTPGPTRMEPEKFGVAVADIGQVDDQGHVSASADGRRLSQWMFDELQRAYEESEVLRAQEIQVWHDSMDPAAKGTTLGFISSDEEAAQLAERINADLVIYGNIRAGESPATFEPKFHVAGLRGEANEIDEITGPFRLGTSIPLRLPLDANDQVSITALREQVTLRARAMHWFTIGFIWDLVGDTTKALQTFKQAEADLRSWPAKGAGKEILYYFIGREALTLGRSEDVAQESGLYDNAEAALADAEIYFQKAIDSNENYARGHIGLAGVHYHRAQQQSAVDRLAANDLNLALKHYRRAAERTEAEQNSPAWLEAHFGLGLAARLEGVTYTNLDLPDEAEASFDLALAELKRVIDPLAEQGQHRTLAQVYLALGVTYSEQARLYHKRGDIAASTTSYEQAQTAFERCQAQGDPAQGGISTDALLRDLIASYCQPYQQRAAEERRALEEGP